MRKAAFAVLLSCSAFMWINSSTVHAEALDIDQIVSSSAKTQATPVLEQINKVSEAKLAAAKKIEATTPTEYEVKAGDSLESIATQHQTTWKRLYDKNEQIAVPDVITVGMKVVIPKADEVVAERALPQPEPVAAPAPPQSAATQQRSVSSGAVAYSSGGMASSAGNRYSPGYCTWYVKNMRPDLPNNLGNADTWAARAAAQGLATGSVPRVGAVGQQGMHVVYVQSVNADGTVTISEMNFTGLYQVSTRTVPASSFIYIY